MRTTSVSDKKDNSTFEIINKKVIIRIQDKVCMTADELFESEMCRKIVKRGIDGLVKRNSFLLKAFGKENVTESDIEVLLQALLLLTQKPVQEISSELPKAQMFLENLHLLNELVEYLYNYWRSYDRFILCDSTSAELDKHPYRTFNATIEQLTHLIRGAYRSIQENITSNHPRIYRQVSAGAEVATISVPKKLKFPTPVFEKLNRISLLRQILICPPLILNPPMNKRTGSFERIDKNPLELVNVNPDEWLGYPAKVGPLLIIVYIHKKFIDLGLALCNLFQLAEDDELEQKPDAIYLFGVPGNELDSLASYPTVFFDDEKNDIMVAAAPNRDEFGYFGYLKKMILTLHNIKMMKQGKLPYHGALVRIILKGNHDATILFIGDTGAGKSETLEALRGLGQEYIQDLIIIADDMGSLEIAPQGQIIGYGTEIGAFLRLDDLQPGYALGQIDRAIIMSPNKINARIILPVTTFENVINGQKVDYIFYANNYDGIDEEHPIVERFTKAEDAFKVFKEGTVMSKGTTTSSGIVHSYFANIFGPPQYKKLHEPLALKYFDAFFEKNVFVGQIRTRLGLAGWERKGPEEAAKELLKLLGGSQ